MANERMTNELTVVGVLVSISDIIERGENSTEIITVRIEQPGKYKNILDIEFFNDKIDDVLELEDNIGEVVRVRGSVNGRLWKKKDDPEAKEKLFFSVIGWSIKLDVEERKTKEKKRHSRSVKQSGKSEDMPGDGMPGDDLDETLNDPPTDTVTEDKKPKQSARRQKANENKEGSETKDDAPF